MNQHFSSNGLSQYNNLVQNLLRHGLTPEQLYQMSMAPVFPPQQNVGSYQPTPQVKHEPEAIAVRPQEAANEEGLLLKMFGTFCKEQPQSAKEMSIAFTKFARWMQSTVDKEKST